MPSALFETIRVLRGAAPFLDGHLERLVRSALAVGVPAPGPGTRDVVADAVRDLGEGVLRVEWDGERVQVATRHARPWGDVRMSIAGERHRGYSHKTTDRDWLDRALAAAMSGGANEALLLTYDGYAAEGAVSAVGFVRRETVLFPPLDLAILPSIGRQRVMDVARELGVGVRERRATPDDLRENPVFVVNAVRGVGHVVSLGSVSLPDARLVETLARGFWPSG